MRIVYMGTPQFAVQPLRALAEAGHEIIGVVTRIDQPAGRGRSTSPPPVKVAAGELGLAIFQPPRARAPEFIQILRDLRPDAIVVAAYGQILPREILELPRYGCINIHASLLPKYRGAAPINWALIRGETETGNTIMQMDEGMDTGAMLLQERMPVEPADTAGTLTEKLSHLGARMIVQALPLIEAGKLAPVAQNSIEATLAPLLAKADGLIDWSLPAGDIVNRVRGLSPWPGAYGFLDGVLVKIIEASVRAGSAEAGVVAQLDKNSLAVGAGKDLLEIKTIQPAGKKPMAAAEFLRGHRDVAGRKFNSVKREG